MEPHTLQLLHGQPTPPEESIPLRAGALTLRYEQGTLRNIRLGEIELLSQIYSAVRDRNWGTVAGQLHNLTMNIEQDQFEIRFESVHQQGEIDFRWQGHISGSTDGTIRFSLSGEAHSRFQRNRIGFCVLHPMSCAGLACRIEQVDGNLLESRFPLNIAPHQPFKSIRTIQHEYQPGRWVEVRMEGDTFEMEDQRNWIDASYKTYCTPLEQPFPVTVEAGTRIEQSITLRLMPVPAATITTEAPRLRLHQAEAPTATLPALGLAAASHTEALSPRACTRLADLKLAHLRLDVHFSEAGWRQKLASDLVDARCMQVPLMIALHLADDPRTELHDFREQFAQQDLPVKQYLIFKQGEKSTRAQWLHLAREVFGASVPLVGGTDAFFTELNRERPEHEAMDGVVYSINPQVHAFDDASLVETLAAQAITVMTARTFSGDKPIHVGPVTFKMRWNPNATAPQPPPEPGQLPHQADPRQMSLLGAGWTLNSIKYLALGGAASATYYETTGYMGIMATESGSALPEQFWNIPGGVYPMYHIFADFADFQGGQLLGITSSDPVRVDGCGLSIGHHRRYIFANLTAEPQRLSCDLRGAFQLRRLDSETAEFAMREPERYRTEAWESITLTDDLDLSLSAFAILTLDEVRS